MKSNKIFVIGITVLLSILLLLFFHYLDFNFFRSDVQWYWDDSLKWFEPFNKVHVPGFPLIIALSNFITFNIFEPVILMQIITVTFLVACSIKIFDILLCVKEPSYLLTLFGLALFTLWPFVGLTYVVHPISDIVAITFYIFGLYFFIKHKESWGSLFWGLTLVTHKALWFFVGLSFFAWLLAQKSFKIFSLLRYLLIMLTPITLLWFFGSFYHNDMFWIIAPSVKVEAQSRNALPFMDGIVSAIFSGGLKGFFKGGLIVLILILTILLIIILLNKRPGYWNYGIAICFSVLILALGLNENTIWAVVRFSRLLVIPLVLVIPLFATKFKVKKKIGYIIVILAAFFLYLSQFAFTYYMAKVFFD